MGFLADRATVIAAYAVELYRQGLPAQAGNIENEVVFILDGVGGFQFTPLLIRRVFRDIQEAPGTVMFRWQFGLPGEIWTDLMWASRNRRKARELSLTIAGFRATNKSARIHVVAFSGGCGLAVWACEGLQERLVDTLVLAAPAVHPEYNMAAALRTVERCYALVSPRDRWILGLGTTLFGTTDRRFSSSAGRLGFRRPAGLSSADSAAYDRLHEIRWSPELRSFGHSGGHTGWAQPEFLREHLLPLLRGTPRLPTHKVP